MAARDELYILVETLSDEEAAATLTYARGLARQRRPTAHDRLVARMEPSAVPSTAFLSSASPGLATLASAQGVRPVAHVEDLQATVWPVEEDPNLFIATLRQWRQAGSLPQGREPYLT